MRACDLSVFFIVSMCPGVYVYTGMSACSSVCLCCGGCVRVSMRVNCSVCVWCSMCVSDAC